MKKMNLVVVALIMALFASGLALAAEPAAQPKSQATCPVLGGNINKNVYVDYKGKRIYFCCPGCIEVFKKNPEQYLEKLKEQGVTPEPVPEAKGKTK